MPIADHVLRRPRAAPACSRPERWKWWVGVGAAGFPVSMAVSTVRGALRPGYDARRDHVSSLCDGDGAWKQNACFAAWGVLTGGYAVGLRALLGRRSPAGRWVPRLAGISAGALAILGWPAVPATRPIAHIVVVTVSYLAWPAAAFLLVPHFAGHARWRGWATYSIVSSVAMWALGAAAGLTMGRAPSGLYERLSMSAMGLWGTAMAARLLLGVPSPLSLDGGA